MSARLTYLAVIMSICLLALAGPAQAEVRTAIVPYAEVGISNYSLEFDGGLIDIGGQLVDGDSKLFFTFFSLKAGLAVTFNNLYMNGYYRTTDEASDTQDPYIFGVTPAIKWQGDRTAISLSGGYSFDNGLSAYIGYRDSETKGSGTANSSNNFSHDGFTLGGAYRLGLTETGGLNFSLGYAWLDVEVDYQPFGFSVPAEGDGSGLKGSIAWRDLINEHWGYTISAEYYAYDYDLGSGGVAEDTEMYESETTLMLGLFYLF